MMLVVLCSCQMMPKANRRTVQMIRNDPVRYQTADRIRAIRPGRGAGPSDVKRRA